MSGDRGSSFSVPPGCITTLDKNQWIGKAVGKIYALPVIPSGLAAVSLTERFGGERSRLDTLACIEEVVTDHLRGA